MKIGNVHISIMAQKEGDNSAIVTSAKRALLYLLLRLGLRKVSTWIFNKQDIYVTSCLIKESLIISLILLSLTSDPWCQEYCSEPTCFTFYLRCRMVKGPVHCRIRLQIRRMLEVLCLLYRRLHCLIFMIRMQQKSGRSLSKLGRTNSLKERN